MSRFRSSTALFLVTCGLGVLASTTGVACGSDATENVDYGQPPDAATFNPGQGNGGDGYGSGGNNGVDAGVIDAGPPVCPEELKRCTQEFTYPFNGETSVELRGDYRDGAWVAGDALAHVGNVWKVSVAIPYNKSVKYKFFVDGQWLADPAHPPTPNDPNNADGNSILAPVQCAYTCDAPPVPPPGVFDWRDAVIYFAFVDRFFDGNPANNCTVAGADPAGQYKGGDWAGVTTKINAGYFTDLGVNTLWVTVPLKNADTFAGHGVGGDTHMYSAFHGYWPTDPNATEPCFGTAAELKGLVDAAHAKSLKVIFDYAMVHVQSSSAVFQQHADWFWPNSDGKGGSCICHGRTYAGEPCTWEDAPEKCWFTDYLPHWNYTVKGARDFSVDAAVALAKTTGVDGFRLDAIKHVDGSWLTQLRSTIESQIVAAQTPPQRFYMVGETYDFGNKGFIKSFVDPKTKLDGQFDFPLRLDLVKATLLRQEGMNGLAAFMDANEDYYGTTAVMSTFVGNHDLPRSIHIAQDTPTWTNPYDDGKNLAWANAPQLPAQRSAFERLANAFAVLLTNKGAPLVYYGDEIGLPGAGDPDNRRFMQWSGLSADQTYLYGRIKALTAIRAAHPALRRGKRATIAADADLWVYSMSVGTDLVYVAINRGDTEKAAPGIPGGLTELISKTPAAATIRVPARQTLIFAK
jgi:glycosidase